MRRFGIIVFSTLLFGVVLYVLLAIIKYMAPSASDGTPAIGFGLPLMTIPLAVLVGIPLVFVILFAALHPRRR